MSASVGTRMNKRLIEAVIAGLTIAAITASAKSIIDVEVLKTENRNVKEIVIEIKEDVKMIRNSLINNKGVSNGKSL